MTALRRLYILMLLFAVVSLAYGQKITRSYQGESLSRVLEDLNTVTASHEISFVYNDLEDFTVTCSFKRLSLEEALMKVVGFWPVRIVRDHHKYFVECTYKAERRLIGRIIDEQGKPVAYANVSLLSPADSSLVGSGLSNEAGDIVIPTDASRVIVRCSFVGYKTACYLYDVGNIGTIRMHPDNYRLDGVTVKGHLITPSADGLTVNIENSQLADIGFASDVLRHLPFVSMINNTFNVIGKGTPLIYINNRLVRDNTELGQLHSSEIKQVKVCLNPGAEYDATVNAVIIIKTIKQTGEGFSGIVDGYAQAERVVSHGASGTLNYRKNGFDVFGSIRYTIRQLEANQTGEQYYSDIHNNEDVSIEGRNYTLTTTLGSNYQWSERSSAGFRYQYINTPRQHYNCFNDETTTRRGVITHYITSKDYRQEKPERHYLNAYCNYGFNDETYLKLDVDFLNGRTITNQDYNLGEISLYSRNEAKNILYAGRLLFSTPLWGGTVKTGAEASYTTNDNHYDVVDDDVIASSIHSTPNEARQRLFAGFVEYAHAWTDNWNTNLGMRYEYTDFIYMVDGVTWADVSKTYAGLFPSASLDYKTGDVSLSLAYRYTTRRPSYFALRNAIAINSPYSYEGGNPMLQPSKMNMLTLTFSWKDLQLMTTYANVKDGTSYVYDIFEGSDSIMFFQTRNVDARCLTLSAYYSPTLFGIWKPALKVHFTKPYISYSGKDYNQPRCYFEMSHHVELTPALKIFCEADCTTAGNLDSELAFHYANFYAQVGCIKTFLHDRLRLVLSVTNLFNTSREKWRLDTNDILYEKWNDDGRRTFLLTATYRFNQSKSKYKGTASTSELNRL